MVDENNHSCFKRSSTVKYLRACSAVRLLVLDYSPVLLGDTEKNLEKPLPPTPRTLRPFGPPLLSEFLLPSVAGGGGYGYMDTFWNYTVQPALYEHPINKDTFHGPLSIHLNAVWPHSSQIVSLKNKSITIPLKHHCWNPRQVEYRHLQRKHLHPLLVIHQYIEPEKWNSSYMHLYSKSTSGDRKQKKLQQLIRPKMAFISLRTIHARLPGPLTKFS